MMLSLSHGRRFSRGSVSHQPGPFIIRHVQQELLSRSCGVLSRKPGPGASGMVTPKPDKWNLEATFLKPQAKHLNPAGYPTKPCRQVL